MPDISQQITDKAKDTTNKDSQEANTSDTSFLTGADARLIRPFMVGFTRSAISVYWVGFGVILLAFVLSLFFKVPPLRKTSALQEAADRAADEDTRDTHLATATGALPLVVPAVKNETEAPDARVEIKAPQEPKEETETEKAYADAKVQQPATDLADLDHAPKKHPSLYLLGGAVATVLVICMAFFC